jgi:hypothetical protein
MSQNDFTIANQGFPAFRADLNSALQALASNSSGATAPSTTFANMWWYDSANNIMYIRNEDNDAWIKFAELDQTNDKFVLSGTLQLDDGTVSAPALTFNSDTNMGIYRGGTDILKFVTAGTDAITINASQDVTFAGNITGGLTSTGDLDVSSTNPRIRMFETDTTNLNTQFQTNGGNFLIKTLLDDASNSTSRITINHSTGDISFYEDTGTTPKFFWDASAEALGIGTASPVRAIHVESSDSLVGRFISTGSTDGFIQLGGSGTSTAPRLGATGNHLLAYTSDTERMRITSAGNVGIGNTNPEDFGSLVDNLVVGTTSGENGITIASGTGNGGRIQFADNTATPYRGALEYDHSTDSMFVYTTGTQRMKIDSAGHVTMPYQSAFQAYGNTNTSISSLATYTTAILNVEVFDQNSDFNTGNYRFTAPVTGKYQLNALVRLDDLQNDSTFYIAQIATSNKEYKVILDTDVLSADLNYHTFTISVLADMDAGDTAEVQAYQNSGTIISTIIGSQNYTVFSGYLVA